MAGIPKYHANKGSNTGYQGLTQDMNLGNNMNASSYLSITNAQIDCRETGLLCSVFCVRQIWFTLKDELFYVQYCFTTVFRKVVLPF